MIKVSARLEKNYYKIFSHDDLNIGQELVIYENSDKASHKLRKKYFALIKYAYCQSNRLDVLRDIYVDAMHNLISELGKFPSYSSFEKNIIELYRKFIEQTICHKHGVSDSKINKYKLIDLYDDTYAHLYECGIDLLSFESLEK